VYVKLWEKASLENKTALKTKLRHFDPEELPLPVKSSASW
jgi:hypothetical protein